MISKQNNRTRQLFGFIVNIVATIAILCFVFGNSMLSKQESAQVSTGVMRMIQGILRPIVELITGGPVDDTLLHKVVRKGAHVTEFAVLSALLTGLLWRRKGTWQTDAMGYVLFLSLLCAVSDEFLQSFTDRGSSVRDVVLDLCGSILGIVFAVALIEFCAWIKQKKRNK